MGGDARKTRRSAGAATVIVVAAVGSVAACYPTFQFDGTSAGGASATTGAGDSASSGVRPTGGSTASTTSSTNANATSSTNANATSNTSTNGIATATATTGGSSEGAPCDVAETMACLNGQACCFELSSSPTDVCVDTCEIDQDGDFFRDHVSLGCNEDSDCGGAVCCVQYTIGGNLRGTYCQSDCEPGIEDHACDPLGGGCAGGSCTSLLAEEYGGAAPPAPYDRYGICL